MLQSAVTATILHADPEPIVFIVSNDRVSVGLVASIAGPDGNLTAINFSTGELAAKRLELRALGGAMRNSAPRRLYFRRLLRAPGCDQALCLMA
jgi:hypothetical protein